MGTNIGSGSSNDSDTPARSPIASASLLLATVLPVLAFVGLTPILPQIEAHFHAQAGASFIVRILVSVIGPTVIVGAPLAGLLATRFGERRVVIWATVSFGLAGSVAYVLDNLYAILASRIIVGLSIAATSTITTVILTKLYTGQARNRWLGYYGTTASLAVLPLIPLCGFLGAINWRLVFLTHVIAIPLVVLFIMGLPRDRSRIAPGQITKAASLVQTATIPWSIPWALIGIGLACGIVASSGNLYLSFHIAQLGVTDSSRIGLVLLPAALTAALGAFAFGMVRSRASASGAFALAFFLAATGYLIVALTTNLSLMIVAMAFAGFGIGMLAPNLFAVAAGMGTEADRSRLFGFTKGAFYGGPLLSQLVLEPVARCANAAAAILVLGFFAALLAVWSIGRVRMERRASQRLPAPQSGS
jgi:predicted MFS family arabinose efflux permease